MEEWLGEFGLRESEEWFLEWPKALGKIAIAFQGLEKKLRPKLMEPIFGTVIAGISELLHQGKLFGTALGQCSQGEPEAYRYQSTS